MVLYEGNIWDGVDDLEPRSGVIQQPLEVLRRKLNKQINHLKEDKAHLVNENEYLKKLLAHHNIPWVAKYSYDLSEIPTQSPYIPHRKLPSLPTEIQLRILGFAMKHCQPIIDPGSRMISSHLTAAEKSGLRFQPKNLLLCCKAFHEEGTKLLWTTNDFVFTQVSAVHNFWKLPLNFRIVIERVTLRIVGQYYNDEEGEIEISPGDGTSAFKKPVIQRCPSLWGWRNGLQGYCWSQIEGFLAQLHHPKSGRLLPSLRTMRIDLVDFSHALDPPKSHFRQVVEAAKGLIAEELLITGMPITDECIAGEKILESLVKDGGLVMGGCSAFKSVGNNSLQCLTWSGGLTYSYVNHEKKLYPKGQRRAWKYVPRARDDSKRVRMKFNRNTGGDLYIDSDGDCESDMEEEEESEEYELAMDDFSELDSHVEDDIHDPGAWTPGRFGEPECANCGPQAFSFRDHTAREEGF